MTERTPVCASLVAQTMPTRLAHCDPGPGIGYRIALYGDDGSWEQVDTHQPVLTHDAARLLIRHADNAVRQLARIAA